MNDVIHTKLRVTDNDILLSGLKKITYSKRFDVLTFHYIDGKKIEKTGGKEMFNLVNLTGSDLFRLINF